MSKIIDIGIIILAAGSSSRMGSPKQLLQVENQPLLVRTIQTATSSSIKNVAVVLGSNEQDHRRIIGSLPITVIHNAHWERGIGNSIKAGLNHHLHNTAQLEGVIILACDQPLLTSLHIDTLVDSHRTTKKPIVVSSYADTVGIPVLFEKRFFSELLALNDDEGAKKIIHRNPNETSTVKFQGGEIDLDTPDDYQNFVRNPT